MTFRFHQQQQQRYSASGFTTQLNKAWEDNASSLNYFIQYYIEGHDMLVQLEERLMHTQKEIGGLIGHFYGIKQPLADAFVRFMQYTHHAIETFKWKKDIAKFRKQWFEAADTLMQMLTELVIGDLRNLFYKQISLTEAIIKSCIKGEMSAKKNYFNKLVEVNRSMAELVSGSIIKNNNTIFG